MQLGCCHLILLYFLWFHFHISVRPIRIDPVQIRAPLVRNRTIPVLQSLEKGNRASSFGTRTFQIQTRSVLVMVVVQHTQSNLRRDQTKRRKPSAITNIVDHFLQKWTILLNICTKLRSRISIDTARLCSISSRRCHRSRNCSFMLFKISSAV